MPNVTLKRENDQELYFAHTHLAGWLFAMVGAGIAAAGGIQLDGAGYWLVVCVGSFFALVGFGAAMWRYEMHIDLMSRSYRGRRGFWPSTRTLSGSLDELNGVVLHRVQRRGTSSNGGGSDYTAWVVGLEFEGWEQPVSVFETQREARAYRQLERLAERLRADVIDRTGREEQRTSWRGRDRSERTGRCSGRLITAPPAASGIDSSIDTRTTSIALPALGFSGGTVLLALLGLPFLGFGAVGLLVLGGVLDLPYSGSVVVGWTLGPLFVLLGSGLALGAIIGGYAREVVVEEGDALIFAIAFFGWRYAVRRLPKREVASVDIRASATPDARGGTEVVVRSDEQIVRIGGALPDEAQRWLSRTLLALAGR